MLLKVYMTNCVRLNLTLSIFMLKLYESLSTAFKELMTEVCKTIGKFSQGNTSLFSGVGLVLFSHVWFFVTPWTVAPQAPPSMDFSRQEYWSGLPFPSPGYLPDPGIEPVSPALAGEFFTTKPPGQSGMGLRVCEIRVFFLQLCLRQIWKSRAQLRAFAYTLSLLTTWMIWKLTGPTSKWIRAQVLCGSPYSTRRKDWGKQQPSVALR